MASSIRPGSALFALVLLLYPVLVYFSLGRVEPRVIGGLLLAVGAARLWQLRRSLAGQWLQFAPLLAVGAVCGLAAMIFNNYSALRLLPALNSAAWLIGFGYTLWRPPSMIERFARLQNPQLDARGVRYTRAVTQVWCGFFAINFIIALYTAGFSDFALWALYNGCIAYVAMGVLFALEYWVRLQYLKRGVQ